MVTKEEFVLMICLQAAGFPMVSRSLHHAAPKHIVCVRCAAYAEIFNAPYSMQCIHVLLPVVLTPCTFIAA